MPYQAKHRRIPLAQAAAATAASAATDLSGPPKVAAVRPRHVRAGTVLLVAGMVAMAVAVARFALHATEPSFLGRMFDLGIYRDGGLIVRHAYHFRSGQPTPLYDWVSPGGGNPFTYPPFAAGLFAVMSFLPLLSLQWGMTALSLAALAAAVWITLDAVGGPAGATRAGSMLLVSAAALWTQPVQSNLGLGQVNMLLMAAIIADLRPARTPRQGTAGRSRWWAGAATGIAAGIKLTPLIFLPYLLLTRRFRQAGVAAAAFLLTVGAGFAAMPGASAMYWRSGLLNRADGTTRANVEFFFASAWNQSLRGLLSRLLQHAQLATVPWLIGAALAVVIGLASAAWLDKDGYPMLGVLTCALTGLLVSPVSWLHHWVWIAPWLAALTALALRGHGAARWRWAALAAATWLVFAAGPSLALVTGSQRMLDLITDVPMKQPLTWTGIDVLAGNAYVLTGLAGLLALFGWGVARAFAQPAKPRLTGSATPQPAQPRAVSSQAD
jgi:alpha-1,2-mannosyltransferase